MFICVHKQRGVKVIAKWHVRFGKEVILNQWGNCVTKTPGIYPWKRTGVVENECIFYGWYVFSPIRMVCCCGSITFQLKPGVSRQFIPIINLQKYLKFKYSHKSRITNLGDNMILKTLKVLHNLTGFLLCEFTLIHH